MTRDNEEFLNVQQDDVSRLTASVNNALFELVPDEAQSITQKQRITRWDNKRKRYVTGTVGELRDNAHIRNESGQLVKGHSKVKRGELYEQWKKNHINRHYICFTRIRRFRWHRSSLFHGMNVKYRRSKINN